MKDNDGRHLRLIDITGKKIGKLTVIKYNNDGTWLCKCDCGNYVNKLSSNLRRNKYPNCGCESRWWKANLIHDHCYERIYNIYEKMKTRCYSKDDKSYKYYGLRGIKICDEWLGKEGFNNFYEWSMAHGYSDALSIDRIDVNGNYMPENCRWTNFKTQQNNKTNNHKLTYNGETHTISEWAEIYNIPYDRLQMRISHGWDIEKALLTPKMNNQFTFYKGEN